MAQGVMAVTLIRPSLEALPGYAGALRRGWSPDNVRGAVTAALHLEKIAEDPVAFVEGLEDREARLGPLTMPDGTQRARLPGFVRWIWDGDFCGSVGFRWQPGSSDLPEHVLGHVGYAVVAWKRGQGLASEGLRLFLPLARAEGLTHIDLTADPDNIPSQKVILNNGGRLLERFRKDEAYGGGESLRFRIDL
ncbi:MAG: GCN5-related N-acetyltransferase [Caulobacter sp.]|nr:GCN5-related N-acetyltransferase [Caulobacter sp.]